MDGMTAATMRCHLTIEESPIEANPLMKFCGECEAADDARSQAESVAQLSMELQRQPSVTQVFQDAILKLAECQVANIEEIDKLIASLASNVLGGGAAVSPNGAKIVVKGLNEDQHLIFQYLQASLADRGLGIRVVLPSTVSESALTGVSEMLSLRSCGIKRLEANACLRMTPTALKALVEAAKTNKSLEVLGFNSILMGKSMTRLLGGVMRVHPRLEQVRITHAGLRSGATKELVAALGKCKNLQLIDLSHNRIGASGIRALASALKRNRKLGYLALNNSLSNPDSAASLFRVAQSHPALRELHLDRNSLKGASIKAAGEMLKLNQSLVTLSLAWNEVENVGADALGKGLWGNGSLKVLRLSNNTLGEEGAIAIGQAMPKIRRLEELYLDSNGLGDSAIGCLLGGALSNPSLRVLGLAGNRASSYAEEEFRKLAEGTSCQVVWHREKSRSSQRHLV